MIQDARFQDMGVPLVFFDLKDQAGFKKLKHIKEIPKLHLYIKETEVTYQGIFERKEILSWLIEKTKLAHVPYLEDLDSFK